MSLINVDTIRNRTGGPPTLSQGVIVSAAATFSGAVSVGGTLTYEDVTNVDVVGIITARGGIKLGAAGIGGTFNANGDTTLAGVVTATSFSGDGSALTGIANTANVNTAGLNVVGVSTFGGDVSIADKIIHTGDTNTAIRFPSADNISFEAGGVERLRIDNVTGNQVIAKDTTASILRVENSTAAASQVAMVDLAPANSLSGVQLKGTSEEDYSTGANRTAFFTVDVRKDGTFSERLRITSAGKVGLGTQAPNYKLELADTSSNNYISLVNTTASDADGLRFSRMLFRGTQSGGEVTTLAAINGAHDGAADDQKGVLSFRTNDGSDGESPTERLRVASAGQLGIGGANYGTDGQVLTSTGASSAPAWEDAGGGGITEVDCWTITGSWPYPQSTWSNARLGNNSGETGTGTLARNTENNMPLGTGMTNTNGLFTFPSSGTWQVDCQLYLERYSSAVCEGLQVSLSGDKDGSSGSLMSVEQDINQYVNHSVINLTGIIKFTNTATTNFYVKLTAATQVYIKALSASQNIIFKKLA